jgi:hypothetical protein
MARGRTTHRAGTGHSTFRPPEVESVSLLALRSATLGWLEEHMVPTIVHELILLDSDSDSYAFYTWQNIMIACWSKRATGPAIEKIARLREAMNVQHPEGVSVVYLIADQAGLPTAEARDGVRKLMQRYSKQRACLAIVVFGEGFWASAMRAAIAGVHLLARSTFPMRVCGRVEDVVEWLPERHERHTRRHIEPEELQSVLQRLADSV